MICCEFHVRGGKTVLGFALSGHAGTFAEGENIVCAAVSSAALLTANAITEVLHAGDAQDGDGYLRVRVPAKDAARCAPMFQGFRLHMNGLAQQYPDHISVCDKEV